MKKPIAALTGVLLILSLSVCFAQAVPAEAPSVEGLPFEVQRYRDTRNGYSILYHAGWTELSRESIDEILAGAAFGSVDLGMELKDLEQYRDIIAQGDLVMFVDPQSKSNFNVVTQRSEAYRGLDAEVLADAVRDEMALSFLYPGAPYEELEAVQVLDIAGRPWIHGAVRFTGTSPARRLDQLFVVEGDRLFTFTFTTDETDGGPMEGLADLIGVAAGSFTP